MALLGGKHHLEVHEKQTWRPLRRQKKPVLAAKQRTAYVKFAKQYKNLTTEEGDGFFFGRMSKIFVSAA